MDQAWVSKTEKFGGADVFLELLRFENFDKSYSTITEGLSRGL